MIRVSPSPTAVADRDLDLPDDRIQLRPHRDFSHEPLPASPSLAGWYSRTVRWSRRGAQDVSWEADIEELRRREALARQMGGPEKVKRQHDAGRLTVRERIDALLDPDSFHEIGAHRGARPATATTASSRRCSRPTSCSGAAASTAAPVVVGGDDFTVRGGAADAAIWQKQVMSEQMANELRLPIVRLVDGTGGGGSVKTIESHGYTYVPANPGWNSWSTTWAWCRSWRWPWARSRGSAPRGSPRATIR